MWFKGEQARELEQMKTMPEVVAQLRVTPEAVAGGVGLSVLVAVVSALTMVWVSRSMVKR